MLKKDLFLTALKNEAAKDPRWVIGAFCITAEAPDEWKKDPFPYRIVRSPSTVFYVDPDNTQELVRIQDANASEALYNIHDRIVVTKEEVPNLSDTQEVSYGNLLINWLLLVYNFGSKIAYINKQFDVGDIESIIEKRLIDEPEDPEVAKDPNVITPSELIAFADAVKYCTMFDRIAVPTDTEKSLQGPPNNKELRESLEKKYAGQLHDPAILAAIQAKLIENDAAWLKGDESEGFNNNSKARTIVRPKNFLGVGAQAGFGDGVKVDYISPSLNEGIDLEKFPIYINESRAGSFNRGRQTMLGGEAVKWLLRVSANIRITIDDCGSNLGVPVNFTDGNINKYMGFSVVTAKGLEVITKENVKTLVGKELMVRSPMFCRLDKTDFCKCCVGPRLASTPFAASVAIAALGDAFMMIFMKAMHGKALQVAHFNYETAFN